MRRRRRVCARRLQDRRRTGKVTFTYTGTNVGDDTIKASITVEGSTQSATAAKKWTETGPPPGKTGKVSARGTLNGDAGNIVKLSAANDCTPAQSTRAFIVEWGTIRFTKTAVDRVDVLGRPGCDGNATVWVRQAGWQGQRQAAGQLGCNRRVDVHRRWSGRRCGGQDRALVVKNGGGTPILTVASQSAASLFRDAGGRVDVRSVGVI